MATAKKGKKATAKKGADLKIAFKKGVITTLIVQIIVIGAIALVNYKKNEIKTTLSNTEVVQFATRLLYTEDNE